MVIVKLSALDELLTFDEDRKRTLASSSILNTFAERRSGRTERDADPFEDSENFCELGIDEVSFA